MKTNLFMFIVFTFVISSLYSDVGITFTFANEEITGTTTKYYEFDLMVQASASGTYIKDTQVYINYSTSGFYENMVDIDDEDLDSLVVSKGNLINSQFIYSILPANNNSSILSVVTTYLQGDATYAALVAYENPVQLVHIKMLIKDSSVSSDLSFYNPYDEDEEKYLMDDQQTYFDSQNAGSNDGLEYNPVICTDTSDEPLPVTLSTFSGIQFGYNVELIWVTQSESNNWLWNIYRSSSSDIATSYQHNGMPVWGAGTTSLPTTYNYLDDELDSDVTTVYWYWLESIDYGGESEIFGPLSVSYQIENEQVEAPEIESEFMLNNYPNPFNPHTNIGIIPDKDGYADLEVYNLKGQLVCTIFKNKFLAKEVFNSFHWNGKSRDGDYQPNGIYLAKLSMGNESRIHRMMLLK